MADINNVAPLTKDNPSLQGYFNSLESRIGYRLILGGTRHHGYYPAETKWPFPITRALRAMEDHLFNSLNLSAEATVLDAGCGAGHVAIYMAKKGLRVFGIDVVDHHLAKANRNIKAENLEQQVSAQKMDYHYLDGLQDDSIDAVYTMEALVHATNPRQALREFYRVLKPGGSVALHEYDHVKFSNEEPATMDKTADGSRGTNSGGIEANSCVQPSKYLIDTWDKINTFASMPANKEFEQGVLPRMLEDIGFKNVEVEDLSHNIEPMLRLFFTIAYLPFLLIRLFGLEKRFINTVSGVEAYRGRKFWRYIVITCTKPDDAVGRGGLDILEVVKENKNTQRSC